MNDGFVLDVSTVIVHGQVIQVVVGERCPDSGVEFAIIAAWRTMGEGMSRRTYPIPLELATGGTALRELARTARGRFRAQYYDWVDVLALVAGILLLLLLKEVPDDDIPAFVVVGFIAMLVWQFYVKPWIADRSETGRALARACEQ